MKLKDFDFRIWDKGEETLTYASKDWKLGIGFSNPQQDYGVCESELHAYYDGEPMCPDDCEIELWSGFYDSKGTKIYEGDIVCIDSNEYIIGFDNSEFYLVNKEAYIQRDEEMVLGRVKDRMQISADIEVIGNIHENAELL